MNSVLNLFSGQISNEVSASTAMDFVRTLQPTKKAQATWSELSLSERARALSKMADEIQNHIASIALDLARSQGLAINFVRENEVVPAITAFRRAAAATASPHTLPKPVGLVSLIAPDKFSFRFLAERVSAALMAGNAAMIATSLQSSPASQWIQKIAKDLPENLIQIYHCDWQDESLLQILCAHPSISAVCAMGMTEQAERVLRLTSGAWKKLQITSGYHNSALILNECNLAEAAQALVKSCFTGMGQLHGNISNILVTESQAEAFQTEFLNALEKKSFASSENDFENFGPLAVAEAQRIEKLWKTLRAENGKILSGGSIEQTAGSLHVRPLVVQDMSHCSVLQQDCLAAPVVLISPVKYVHDMFKWANTSYFGMIAQVFGPEEKIQKFAPKLDVSRICGSSWLSPDEPLPLGIKQSFSGIAELHPFGSFFSDVRKIDGAGSRI